MVAPVEDLVREHGHVDARVALATDPQVMEAVVGEHVEPVAQERVVVLSFVQHPPQAPIGRVHLVYSQ